MYPCHTALRLQLFEDCQVDRPCHFFQIDSPNETNIASFRSSRPEVFYKIGVLNIWQENTCVEDSF